MAGVTSSPRLFTAGASVFSFAENNRKAKYYRLTPAGRQHLIDERHRWESMVQAIARVLGPATE